MVIILFSFDCFLASLICLLFFLRLTTLNPDHISARLGSADLMYTKKCIQTAIVKYSGQISGTKHHQCVSMGGSSNNISISDFFMLVVMQLSDFSCFLMWKHGSLRSVISPTSLSPNLLSLQTNSLTEDRQWMKKCIRAQPLWRNEDFTFLHFFLPVQTLRETSIAENKKRLQTTSSKFLEETSWASCNLPNENKPLRNIWSESSKLDSQRSLRG